MLAFKILYVFLGSAILLCLGSFVCIILLTTLQLRVLPCLLAILKNPYLLFLQISLVWSSLYSFPGLLWNISWGLLIYALCLFNYSLELFLYFIFCFHFWNFQFFTLCPLILSLLVFYFIISYFWKLLFLYLDLRMSFMPLF